MSVWANMLRSSSLSCRASELDTQTAQPAAAPSVYKFFFNIGSIESFERKMEEAQEDLGLSPNDFVPIVYTNELSWQQAGFFALAAMCHICSLPTWSC